MTDDDKQTAADVRGAAVDMEAHARRTAQAFLDAAALPDASPATITRGEAVRLIVQYAEKKALLVPAGEALHRKAQAMGALNNVLEAALDGVVSVRTALERIDAAQGDLEAWLANAALEAWTDATITLVQLTPPAHFL